MKSKPRRLLSMSATEALARCSLVLLIAELVLVLLSWILAATMTEGVRSLLSGEGLRWLFGRFARFVASPPLAWLLLLLIAGGCLVRSQLLSRRQGYRDRIALRFSLAFLLAYVAFLLLLTAMPHALLLSATGSLFPSAFSAGLVPAVAFGLVLVSVAYGSVSGRFRSLGDVLDSLSFGIRRGAPLFFVYILLIQFYESLRFVFG